MTIMMMTVSTILVQIVVQGDNRFSPHLAHSLAPFQLLFPLVSPSLHIHDAKPEKRNTKNTTPKKRRPKTEFEMEKEECKGRCIREEKLSRDLRSFSDMDKVSNSSQTLLLSSLCTLLL